LFEGMRKGRATFAAAVAARVFATGILIGSW
jgi:hypothetical protein